jgi:hypothetical protein
MGGRCKLYERDDARVLVYNKGSVEGKNRRMVQENELSPGEIDALREIARPSLLKKPIPAIMQDRLIKLEYVEQKLGNLVATAKDRVYIASPLKPS